MVSGVEQLGDLPQENPGIPSYGSYALTTHVGRRRQDEELGVEGQGAHPGGERDEDEAKDALVQAKGPYLLQKVLEMHCVGVSAKESLGVRERECVVGRLYGESPSFTLTIKVYG